MSVNGLLARIADAAIMRDDEKASVARSVETLKGRIKAHFAGQVADCFVFGSYSRGTNLTRAMDENSDVDVMVVFSDGSSQPQTYLDRLRRFAQACYSTSEIEQSSPTIVLSLNHIRFELVPAINNWGSLKIPAKASDLANWQETDPHGFTEKLTAANKARNSLIKPLARVMKYWNARAGHPFESYALEKVVVEQDYSNISLARSFLGDLFMPERERAYWNWTAPPVRSPQLRDYFYAVVKDLTLGWWAAQWRKDAISRLQTAVSKAKEWDVSGRYDTSADDELKWVLPAPD